MKDGRVLSTRTEPAKGDPRNPMSYEEVADKFRGNAAYAKWPRQKAESVITLVQSLELMLQRIELVIVKLLELYEL